MKAIALILLLLAWESAAADFDFHRYGNLYERLRNHFKQRRTYLNATSHRAPRLSLNTEMLEFGAGPEQKSTHNPEVLSLKGIPVPDESEVKSNLKDAIATANQVPKNSAAGKILQKSNIAAEKLLKGFTRLTNSSHESTLARFQRLKNEEDAQLARLRKRRGKKTGGAVACGAMQFLYDSMLAQVDILEQMRGAMVKPLRMLETAKAKVGFMGLLFKGLDGFIDAASAMAKEQRNVEMEACG